MRSRGIHRRAVTRGDLSTEMAEKQPKQGAEGEVTEGAKEELNREIQLYYRKTGTLNETENI